MGRNWIIAADMKHQTFGDDDPSLYFGMLPNVLIEYQKSLTFCACTVHRWCPPMKPIEFTISPMPSMCQSEDCRPAGAEFPVFKLLQLIFVPISLELWP